QLVLTTVYLQPAMLDLVPGLTLKELGSDPGVVYAAPLLFGDSYRGRPIIGATGDLVTQAGQAPLANGRPFASTREVVIGADVPLRLGDHFAPTHGQPTSAGGLRDAPAHDDHLFTVVGRMTPRGSPWDRAIIAPVEALWEIHARPRGHAAGS